MSKEEALGYFSGRGLSDKLALKLYGLIGGRVVQLEWAAKLSKKLLSKIESQDEVFEGMYKLRRKQHWFLTTL